MARRRRGHVGMAALSTVLAVLAVEGTLRLVEHVRAPRLLPGYAWMRSDTILGHRNIPGYRGRQGFTIDALGLRGPGVTVPKPPGTVRILCLGDSTTFGTWREGTLGLRFDTSYPAELERLLHERGWTNVEVVNGGVMGYTTAHALRLLLTTLRSLEPDVVTIRLGNNDHTLLGAQPWWISSATPYALLRTLPAWSFEWQVVRLGVDAWQRETAPPLPPSPVYKVSLAELERNYVRLFETARRMGARPLVLDFPYRPIDQGPWRGEPLPNGSTEARSLEELHAIHARYQAVVLRVAEAHDVPVVATAAALRSAPVRTFTDFDNSHPNADGLRIIGSELATALARLHWLGPRPAP
jgi:lysophospholipase L1-like esterase